MTFAYYLSLVYVGATLLTSGVGHALGAARFRDLLRAHGIIPAGLAATAAFSVTAFELAAGSYSLAVLLNEEHAALASPLFAVCAAAGGAFTLYIRRLLRRPEGVTSCGCSPFASPLTPASLVPASALLLMSTLGLVVSALGYGRPLGVTYGLIGAPAVLPPVWGVTLALLIILLPASMPRPAARGWR